MKIPGMLMSDRDDQRARKKAEPTAMETRMREAMERAKARSRKTKLARQGCHAAQEDLLSRTLENKVHPEQDRDGSNLSIDFLFPRLPPSPIEELKTPQFHAGFSFVSFPFRLFETRLPRFSKFYPCFAKRCFLW